jgi:hypothetical protein
MATVGPPEDFSGSDSTSINLGMDLNTQQKFAGGNENSLEARELKLVKDEEDVQRRMKEIERREKELDALEAGKGPNNWPFPFCKIARNAIDEDIPKETFPERHQVIKHAEKTMLLGFLCFFWNFCCMCAYAAAGDSNHDHFENVGLSIAYMLFGFPGSFYIWYYVLYKGCMTDTSTYYFIFLATYACSTLFWIAAAVGIPNTGMAGFISMCEQFDRDYNLSGFFQIVQLVLVCCLISYMIFVWKRARDLWVAKGGSDATKEEVEGQVAQKAAEEAIKNPGAVKKLAGA